MDARQSAPEGTCAALPPLLGFRQDSSKSINCARPDEWHTGRPYVHVRYWIGGIIGAIVFYIVVAGIVGSIINGNGSPFLS